MSVKRDIEVALEIDITFAIYVCFTCVGAFIPSSVYKLNSNCILQLPSQSIKIHTFNFILCLLQCCRAPPPRVEELSVGNDPIEIRKPSALTAMVLLQSFDGSWTLDAQLASTLGLDMKFLRDSAPIKVSFWQKWLRYVCVCVCVCESVYV